MIFTIAGARFAATVLNGMGGGSRLTSPAWTSQDMDWETWLTTGAGGGALIAIARWLFLRHRDDTAHERAAPPSPESDLFPDPSWRRSRGLFRVLMSAYRLELKEEGETAAKQEMAGLHLDIDRLLKKQDRDRIRLEELENRLESQEHENDQLVAENRTLRRQLSTERGESDPYGDGSGRSTDSPGSKSPRPKPPRRSFET